MEDLLNYSDSEADNTIFVRKDRGIAPVTPSTEEDPTEEDPPAEEQQERVNQTHDTTNTLNKGKAPLVSPIEEEQQDEFDHPENTTNDQRVKNTNNNIGSSSSTSGTQSDNYTSHHYTNYNIINYSHKSVPPFQKRKPLITNPLTLRDNNPKLKKPSRLQISAQKARQSRVKELTEQAEGLAYFGDLDLEAEGSSSVTARLIAEQALQIKGLNREIAAKNRNLRRKEKRAEQRERDKGSTNPNHPPSRHDIYQEYRDASRPVDHVPAGDNLPLDFFGNWVVEPDKDGNDVNWWYWKKYNHGHYTDERVWIPRFYYHGHYDNRGKWIPNSFTNGRLDPKGNPIKEAASSSSSSSSSQHGRSS